MDRIRNSGLHKKRFLQYLWCNLFRPPQDAHLLSREGGARSPHLRGCALRAHVDSRSVLGVCFVLIRKPDMYSMWVQIQIYFLLLIQDPANNKNSVTIQRKWKKNINRKLIFHWKVNFYMSWERVDQNFGIFGPRFLSCISNCISGSLEQNAGNSDLGTKWMRIRNSESN